MRSLLLKVCLVGLGVCPIIDCISTRGFETPVRDRLTKAYQGRIFSLKRSLYVGGLYDDNERQLLSDQAFALTSHFSSKSGAPVHPTEERGIMQAGTLVKVKAIEFPNLYVSYVRRIARSPRFLTWLVLESVDSNDSNPEDPPAAHVSPPLVFVMQSEGSTERDFQGQVDALLGESERVTMWLSARSEHVLSAITNKEVFVGMTVDEVTASLGPPLLQFVAQFINGTKAQIDWYPDLELWWQGQHLLEIRPSRDLAQARAQLPANLAVAPTSK